MTPKSIYGKYAGRIQAFGECWIWTGPNIRGWPYVQLTRRTIQRTVTYGLNQLGGNVPAKYRMVCQKTCVHPEHAVDDMSEVGRLVCIRENSAVVDDCVEWLGAMGDRNPELLVRDPQTGNDSVMPVRKLLWCTEFIPFGLEWPQGFYTASCGNRACVKISHIAVEAPYVELTA